MLLMRVDWINFIDALGHTVGTLKMLAIATGEEVDRSVVQINRLTSKVDRTDSSCEFSLLALLFWIE